MCANFGFAALATRVHGLTPLERSALTVAFAILPWLAFTDFITRPDFPPRPEPAASVAVLSLAR